jgi:hypothetical protein
MKKRIFLLIFVSVIAGFMCSFGNYKTFCGDILIIIYLSISIAKLQLKQEKRWKLVIDGKTVGITWSKKIPCIEDFGYSKEDYKNIGHNVEIVTEYEI